MKEHPSPSEAPTRTDRRPVSPTERWVLVGCCFLIVAVATGIGIPVLRQGACPSCTGLLSLALPWLGAAYYSAVGALAWRYPHSPRLTDALSFAVFVHSCLVTEMVLLGRFCVGCMSIAGFAWLAALIHARRVVQARLPLTIALVLGSAAGFTYPGDRVEDALTRRLWPAHVLSQAPAFVDRGELSSCAHPSAVRLLSYQDQHTCQSCAGLERKLFNRLTRDFPTTVCVHDHLLRQPSPGQVLPVIVLMSAKNRLLVYEGVPDYESFTDLLRAMIRETWEGPR